jgi:nitrite reductase/ring-hydroxylating ferredoxin subunit
MKRAPGLIEVSRRDFCAFACLGAAGATLAACFDSGKGAVQTGGLDGTGDNNGTVDAPSAGSGSGSGSNVQPHPDGGTGPTPDGGVAATCSGTYTDVGTPASYTVNVPKYLSSIGMFVVKDSSGFYAMTSRCTHQGVTLNNYSGGSFHCNAHGADFNINGAVLGGPTNTPLAHYSMCTLASGNLGVETTIKVAATVRLMA